MSDLSSAKERLITQNHTCVLCKSGEEYYSDLRGVEPLLDFLDSGHDFSGFSAADKTVGAGAAHLYVALGIKAVWANVISEIGIKILKENNIHVSFNECVPHIINRKGDGICPIENSVKDISSTDTAIEKIRKTLQNLS